MSVTIILLLIGLVAGVLSGLVGVGGGIVIVPALVFFVGMNQHTAQGTSLAVLLLPVGILAVFNYYKSEYVDVRATLLIAVTFVVGSFLGSKISIAFDQALIKRIFGVFLLAIGLKMMLSK